MRKKAGFALGCILSLCILSSCTFKTTLPAASSASSIPPVASSRQPVSSSSASGEVTSAAPTAAFSPQEIATAEKRIPWLVDAAAWFTGRDLGEAMAAFGNMEPDGVTANSFGLLCLFTMPEYWENHAARIPTQLLQDYSLHTFGLDVTETAFIQSYLDPADPGTVDASAVGVGREGGMSAEVVQLRTSDDGYITCTYRCSYIELDTDTSLGWSSEDTGTFVTHFQMVRVQDTIYTQVLDTEKIA